MNRIGTAFITILIIAILLFVLVGAFLALITHGRRLNERYHEGLVALSLAEAGADYAIQQINFVDENLSSWSGGNPKSKTLNNFQDDMGYTYGNVDIEVYNPGTSDVRIVSTGTFDTTTGPPVSRRIQVYLKQHRIFDYAILTVEEIVLNGTPNVDSYDSSAGSYGGDNQGQDGDIATNGSANPAITLSGSTTIEGDANTGPGGTVLIEGSSTLTGDIDDTADEFIPPSQVPDSLASLASEGTLSSDETLTDGSYKYDSINLGGNDTLVINGEVALYVTGDVKTTANSEIVVSDGSTLNIYFDGELDLGGNGVLNEGGDPSDLTFYGSESATSIDIAGIGTFYGTIYAPQAEISISGNSEIFGAVVGHRVNHTGIAAIHYDIQLRNDGATIGYDPYAWQEI